MGRFDYGLNYQCQFHLSWVIVVWTLKLANLYLLKILFSAGDYAKLYIREIVRLHGFVYLLFLIVVLSLHPTCGGHFKRLLVWKCSLGWLFILLPLDKPSVCNDWVPQLWEWQWKKLGLEKHFHTTRIFPTLFRFWGILCL